MYCFVELGDEGETTLLPNATLCYLIALNLQSFDAASRILTILINCKHIFKYPKVPTSYNKKKKNWN